MARELKGVSDVTKSELQELNESLIAVLTDLRDQIDDALEEATAASNDSGDEDD